MRPPVPLYNGGLKASLTPVGKGPSIYDVCAGGGGGCGKADKEREVALILQPGDFVSGPGWAPCSSQLVNIVRLS